MNIVYLQYFRGIIMFDLFKKIITNESSTMIWFCGFFVFLLTNVKLTRENYESYVLIATIFSILACIVLKKIVKKIVSIINKL